MLGQGHVQLHPAFQCVLHRLEVAAALAHIPPISGGDLAVKGTFLPQKFREQVLAEVEGFPLRHQVQDGGGEQVDTGVHLVGEHLTPARFFHKGQHTSLLVGTHQAVFQRFRHPVEEQGRLRLALAVEAVAVGQVEVGDAIAADDQKILLPQEVPAGFHPACGTQRGVLVEVVQVHPPGAAVAEVAGDGLRVVVESHGCLGDLVTAQQQ